MIEAPDILEKAAATMRERSAERDTEKERAMARTVAMFNAAFPDTPLSEYQGWMFMLFLKMARAHGGSFRLDDYIDMSAYAALAAECRALAEAPPSHGMSEEALMAAHERLSR